MRRMLKFWRSRWTNAWGEVERSRMFIRTAKNSILTRTRTFRALTLISAARPLMWRASRPWKRANALKAKQQRGKARNVTETNLIRSRFELLGDFKVRYSSYMNLFSFIEMLQGLRIRSWVEINDRQMRDQLTIIKRCVGERHDAVLRSRR